MGTILHFPRHARTSAGPRAANSAKSSAVNPCFWAVSVRNSGSHHSAGMRRSGAVHLRTAHTPAPISAASASGESHSATISRKLETMEGCLGHLVPNCKPIVSQDCELGLRQNVPMVPASAYKREFTLRVRWARHARGWGPSEMAELLKIDQGKYKQYERRSLMPHYLVPEFLRLCLIDYSWLATGIGRAPVGEPPTQKRRKPRKLKRVAA